MRRRLSLALLLILVAVASQQYLSHRARTASRLASARTPRDSLARVDSAARADSLQSVDTLCFASRIGLPCAPR